jgi:hypothetical protein
LVNAGTALPSISAQIPRSLGGYWIFCSVMPNNRLSTTLIDKVVVEYVEQSPILPSYGTITCKPIQRTTLPLKTFHFVLYVFPTFSSS